MSLIDLVTYGCELDFSWKPEDHNITHYYIYTKNINKRDSYTRPFTTIMAMKKFEDNHLFNLLPIEIIKIISKYIKKDLIPNTILINCPRVYDGWEMTWRSRNEIMRDFIKHIESEHVEYIEAFYKKKLRFVIPYKDIHGCYHKDIKAYKRGKRKVKHKNIC